MYLLPNYCKTIFTLIRDILTLERCKKKCANVVGLEHTAEWVFLQTCASIQPRKSPDKARELWFGIASVLGLLLTFALSARTCPARGRSLSLDTLAATARTYGRGRSERPRWKLNGKFNVRENENWMSFKTKLYVRISKSKIKCVILGFWSDFPKIAALNFWENPEKNWSNLAKFSKNSAKIQQKFSKFWQNLQNF